MTPERKEVASVAVALVRGLGHLHSRGRVLGCLRPSVVWLRDSPPSVLFADASCLARHATEAATRHPNIRYAAPEVQHLAIEASAPANLGITTGSERCLTEGSDDICPPVPVKSPGSFLPQVFSKWLEDAPFKIKLKGGKCRPKP